MNMALEDDWEVAWENLEFLRKALARSIGQKRPRTDPLRREQAKAHAKALSEYEAVCKKL
jgi:hypothetical protein